MKSRTRSALLAAAIFAAGLLGGVVFMRSDLGQPPPVPAPALPPPPVPEGRNGLSDAEREEFYHLSEGGELYPVDWLLALEVETTAADGTRQVRPFLENIERYGLLSDHNNPDGLPVGISLARSKISGSEMIGLNCTACHVGQIQYQGNAVRIDGLGNMVLVNAFLMDMAAETANTLRSPRRLARFWRRVREMRAERRARGRGLDAEDADESLLRRLVHMVTSNRDLLEAKLDVLRSLPVLERAIALGTSEGYGRLDAFGIGRDELYGGIAGNAMPPNAPVSLPHIWGMEYTGWLQWGANTNSVMERNIGQALGVGATFNATTFESTLRIDNLHKMETYAYKLTPPTWPASFPDIDEARAARGRTLFVDHCVECHQVFELDGVMRTYELFSTDHVGTDPMTALNFELPVKEADGTIKPFPYAALELIKNVKQRAYEDAGYTAEQIYTLEERDIRRGPQWDPTFRAPLLDSEDYADTKGRKVYRAKTLVGIWATGPFLHNGSVPTIYDLLTPADERPVTFPLGTREYDTVKLGVETDPTKYELVADQQPFTFDTRLPGNWNTGHEWEFYPSLTDDDRYAIIEFLKTFTDEAQLAGTAATIPPVAPPGPIGDGVVIPAGTPAAPDGGLTAGTILALLAGLVVAGAAGRGVAGFFLPHGEAARATEAEDTKKIVEDILVIQKRYAAEQNRPLARGTHAKGTAVRAQFEVFDVFENIPDHTLASRLAQGLFAKPGVYPAWVRFANAQSFVFPDRNKDVRACSFAVEVPADVFGPEPVRLDFSMNNARTFPINDTHEFVIASSIATAPTPLKGIMKLPFRDKLAFLRIAALGAVQQRPPKTAYQQTTYWSNVPFHHGPADVIKYGAFPAPGNYAQPLSKGINCLQDELKRHVEEDEQMSCFDFGIQLLDVDKMTYWGRRRTPTFWIENASVRWKDHQAPFHIVGRLTLVAKSVIPAEEVARMYISVAEHSAPDCKPMGGINRARPLAEHASHKARVAQLNSSSGL